MDDEHGNAHYYVIDICDEYVCAECGENPCAVLDPDIAV